jgi:ComF family protein
MRFLTLLATVGHALADLAFPPRCVACSGPAWTGEAGDPLCGDCLGGLDDPGERCPRCARAIGPGQGASPCAGCREEELRLDGAVAAWSYGGVARGLVVALKYGRVVSASRPLARGLAGALLARGIPGDLVVPVPASARRRRERGFDQAEEIARRVARALGIGLAIRGLVRVRHTPPQAGLSRSARRRALRGAFRARTRSVEGRCVILVDDVLTTGSTVRASSLALRRAGALAVTAAVACRTEDPDRAVGPGGV